MAGRSPIEYKTRPIGRCALTPQLEAAIAAIQPLSPPERQQLLQTLTQNDLEATSQPNLEALSIQFWQGISLQELRATQIPTTVHNLKDLAADCWPVEDSVEAFLAFLQEQRQEVS